MSSEDCVRLSEQAELANSLPITHETIMNE